MPSHKSCLVTRSGMSCPRKAGHFRAVRRVIHTHTTKTTQRFLSGSTIFI